MFSIKGFLILFINYKYKGELLKNIMIAYDKIDYISFFYYTSELILFLFVTSFGVNILFSLLKKKLIFFLIKIIYWIHIFIDLNFY